MQNEVVENLLALNRRFYSEFAAAFSQTRLSPQPGFENLIDYLPGNCRQVVDIGCGNGRFGQFLRDQGASFQYTGIDFTSPLLQIAEGSIAGEYLQRDISKSGFLQGLESFDLSVCLATMQHIPGWSNRLGVLKEMASHLAEDGRIFLSSWQFAHSERQQRKILDWHEVGLNMKDLEENDFLLSWQRNGRGVRYVHLLESTEIASMAKEASLDVISEFRSDGREGDLNLYSILAHSADVSDYCNM